MTSTRANDAEPGAAASDRQRVTVYNVAQRAGVSIATVSYAFRRPDKVRPETRDRVLAVADDLGYVPRASARSLAEGQTGVLGLFAFDMLIDRPLGTVAASTAFDTATETIAWSALPEDEVSNPLAFPLYADEVQRGFELECRALGRSLLISGGEVRSSDVRETAGRVDGLAVFPHGADRSEAVMAALRSIAKTVPVVLFAVPADAAEPFHYVTADNSGGMFALAQHLVLTHGVRRVHYLGQRDEVDLRDRFDGLVAATAAAGIAAPSHGLDVAEADLADLRAHLDELLGTEAGLPDAFVCDNDQRALLLMEELRWRGIRVPHDVIVTGFDGTIAGLLSSPTLTSVRQPMVSMGMIAARVLATPELAGSARLHYRLGTELRLRQSCGCG
ncbi:MAG: LacI family DNA-binding transcriptional regulator [Protaetiibacter sp.]